MPDTNDYSQIPVPLYPEDPDLPVALAAVRESIRPRLVLFATSESNRDSLYGSKVPPGTLVSSTTTSHVWKKLPSGWATVFYDSGWISLANASFPGDFSDNASAYRIVGSTCALHIDATWNGNDISGGTGGSNIGDQKILDLPAAACPEFAFSGSYYAGAGGEMRIFSSGGVYITDIQNGSTLPSGARVIGSATYILG